MKKFAMPHLSFLGQEDKSILLLSGYKVMLTTVIAIICISLITLFALHHTEKRIRACY